MKTSLRGWKRPRKGIMGTIREVKWRTYEEICFNIETYHGTPVTERIRQWAREVEGKPVRIIFRASSKIELPGLSGNCTLPVFRDASFPPGNRGLVCAHLCEID